MDMKEWVGRGNSDDDCDDGDDDSDDGDDDSDIIKKK
jgi:hypothetical protein